MKRNLRKYLSGMLSALLFVACILTPVNAHASSGLAVSAGKNFGDGVDTRQDAIDASTAYGNAGYSTVTLQSPTKSDFTSENLSADILFLSGHGNADVLSFGTYKIVCQSGTIPTCGILHPTKNLSLLQGAIPLEEAIKMEVLAQQVIILLNE